MKIETIPRRLISFRMNDELIKSLRIEAKKRNRSLNNLVESILIAFISKRVNEFPDGISKDIESESELDSLNIDGFQNIK